MANPDILITPGQGTIGFSGTNTGTIQLRVAESGDIHFEGDQGSLLSLSDDLSDSLFSVNDAAGMPVFEVFADDTIKAYRNNETKLEIDPDNNRIRLRDNLLVSGDLTVSGDITSASASHEATSYTASTHVSGLSGYFGNLGIGASVNNNNNAIVDIQGAGTATLNVRNQAGSSNSTIHLGEQNTSLYGVELRYEGNLGNAFLDNKYNHSTRPHIYFRMKTSSSSNMIDAMAISPKGYLGVGPFAGGDAEAMLQVSGDASITGELKTNGFVGIGTTPASAQLTLKRDGGNGSVSSAIYLQRAAGNYGAAILQVGHGTAGYEKLMFTAGHNTDPTAIGNSRMTITSSGNIGIGSNNPNAYDWNASSKVLEVFQNDSNGSILKLRSNSTNTVFAAGNAHLQFGNISSHPIKFYTAGSQKMVLQAAGQVGIGTSAPGTLLEVYSSAPAVSIKDGGQYATNATPHMLFKDGNGIISKIGKLNDTNTVGFDVETVSGDIRLRATSSADPELRVTSSGVGIGTQYPDKFLTLHTDSPIIGLYSNYADSNARNWAITTNNTAYGDFTLSNSAAKGGNPNAVKVTILKEGYVGIGTRNPAELLTISGANATVRINSPTTAGSDTAAYAFGFNANADLAGMRLDHSDRVTSGLALFVHPAYGYPINITPAPSKDIFLNVMDGGGVGIGTSNATELLEVDGNIRLGDGNHRNIIGPTNATLGIYANPNDSNEGIKFSTDGGTTIEMFLEDGGNVGIGPDLDPTSRLHVNSAGSDFTLRLSSAASRAGMVIDHPSSTDIMGSALVLASDNTYRLGTASYYHVSMTQAGGTELFGNGSPKMIINPDGEIIMSSAAGFDNSTSSLGAQLVVSGDASITGQLVVGGGQSTDSIKLIRNSSTSPYIGWYSAINSREAYIQATTSHLYINNDNNANIELQTNGGLNFTVSPTATISRQDIIIPQDKYLYVEGDSDDAFNRIGRNSSENALLLTSRFHAAMIIDSNNDDTNSEFSIRHDGTTLADSSSLFSVIADGTSTFGGGGTGKVGINTTAPTGRLHIYQSGDSQPAFLVEGSQGSLFSVEDTLTGSLMSVNDIAGLPVFEAFDDGTIVMGQYNSGDLVVTGNKVGIGTSNPLAKLHLYGTGTPPGIILECADNAQSMNIDYYNNVGAVQSRIGYDEGAGQFSIQPNQSTVGTHVYFKYDGKVGVGLSAPQAKLQVDGDASITGETRIAGNVGIGAAPSFKLQVDGTVRVNNGDLFLDDGDFLRWGGTDAKIDGSSGGDYLRFYTNGSVVSKFGVNEFGFGTGTVNSNYAFRVVNKDYGIFSVNTSASDRPSFVAHHPRLAGTRASVLTYFDQNGGTLGGGATTWSIYANNVNDGAATADFAINTRGNSFSDAFIVTNAGSVFVEDNLTASGIAGIGINPSSHRLEVAGGSYNSNLKLKGGGAAVGIQFADSDNNTDGYIYAAGTNIGFLDAGTDWMVRCVNDQFIYFATNGNTQHMRVNSDGKVLIGEGQDPTALLTVSGDASITGDLSVTRFIKHGGDEGTKIDFGSTEIDLFANNVKGISVKTTEVAINDNSADVDFRVESNNKTHMLFVEGETDRVGIGTSDPVAALHIHGNSDNGDDDCQLIISDADTSAGSKIPSILFRSLNDAGSAYVGTNRIRGTKGYGMQFATETSSEGVLGTVMTLDNSQKVGIGTTSPDVKLHLYGGGSPQFRIQDSTNNCILKAYAQDSDAFLGTHSNHNLNIGTNNATNITVEAGGNVGIGITVPSGRLHVENNSTGIIVANDQITGNAFEVFGAQGNLLTVTDDLSDSLFSVNDAAGMPVFEVFADDTIKSYRNNESKLEVDPDNNRIRLRDNVSVSGTLTTSGQITAEGATAFYTAGGRINIGTADTTSARLNILGAGATNATSSLRIFRQGGQESFRVYDDGRVNVGSGATPEATLQVNGDAQISGHIRAGQPGHDGMRMGNWEPADGYGYLQNEALDPSDGDNYAVLQQNNGTTYINAADGRTLFLRVENATEYDSEITASGVLWNRGGLPNADFAVKGDNNNVFKVDAGDEYLDLQTAKLKIAGTGSAGKFLKSEGTDGSVSFETVQWNHLPAISTLAEI